MLGQLNCYWRIFYFQGHYQDKSFIFKKVPAIMVILELLSLAKGLVIFVHRMRKVAQGASNWERYNSFFCAFELYF